MLLHDVDVQCELPFDADDEYITPKGFLPCLPGETTRLSSALAFFKLTKLLSKILAELYPAASSHEVSLRNVEALQDELEAWSQDLAPHLRLQFEKDKPSTGVISHRSPILVSFFLKLDSSLTLKSLAYHYTHTFISRAVLLASPAIPSRSNASILSLASSSKRIAQVIELLDERGLALALCLSEKDLLRQSAVGLLLQHLEMGSETKLIGSIFEKLDASDDFSKLADICLKDRSSNSHRQSYSESKTQKQAKRDEKRSSKSKSNKSSSRETESKSSRKSLPLLPTHSLGNRASSTESMSSYQGRSDSIFARSEASLSPIQQYASYPTGGNGIKVPLQNLDYISFGSGPDAPLPFSAPASAPMKEDGNDWVQMLSNLDGGHSNIYDNIYGGPGGPGGCRAGQAPPSLGDYSSLASNSPPTMNSVPLPSSAVNMNHDLSQECDTNDLWTIVQDFKSPDELVDAARNNIESPITSVDEVGTGVSNGVGFSLFESFL
jgi:hypothetical protein